MLLNDICNCAIPNQKYYEHEYSVKLQVGIYSLIGYFNYMYIRVNMRTHLNLNFYPS